MHFSMCAQTDIPAFLFYFETRVYRWDFHLLFWS